jgi:predicted amidohydrolase YtcJ
MAADLVIRNARVHAVDEAIPRADAVAVGEGTIAWVGAEGDVDAFVGPATEVLDGEGATLLPGFVDAHNHVRLGSNPGAVQLAGATSLEDIRARIAAFLDARPDATWVEGEGWNYAAIPGGAPTAEMLWGATRGLPAFLFSYDVHTVWLNHEAMATLGVTRDADRLPWGTLEKDDTGEPTGFVHDFAVLGLSEEGQRALEGVVPGYAKETQYERLVASLDMAIGYGITTIVEPQNGLDDLALFDRARREGTLRSRLIAALLCLPGTSSARLDELALARATYDDDRFRVAPIKLYIDDVIEPHTAAMLAPYADRSDTSGELFWDLVEFSSLMVELERRGFQAFTHATGDRGVRAVLGAIERCRAVFGDRDVRHQIVHAECIHPDDLPRFGRLGVVACMQPRHCAPDLTAEWRASVGPERERYAWPFRSLLELGATLALSSDWNVAEMDPMTWLYTAVTRADLEGNGAWNTAETIDLAAAVRAATLGSATANFAERDRGTITPGKRADLALLSRDLFDGDDPSAILETRVVATMVDGEVVYRAPASA